VGVVSGEFNGDEEPDIAVANGTSNDVAVLLGTGAGSFPPASFFPTARTAHCAARDLDEMRIRISPARCTAPNKVSILLNAGDGTFGAPTAFDVGLAPTDVAIEDLDGDAVLDLVVSNKDSDDVSILLGVGDGTFGPAEAFPAGDGPQAVAIGDLDGDTVPDLAVADYNSDSVAILLCQREPVVAIDDGSPTSPRSSAVLVRPNPLQARASVHFAMPSAGRARVAVFGIDGRLVAMLLDGLCTAGPQRIDWNGVGAHGGKCRRASTSFRVDAGEVRSTRRFVVVK